ncbi:LysR family transcriptional regulator [Amycolatopsis sp. NPDC051102]|uniref:LysR family transcriptional regulator n=1 Tax=Amycolatopsis sp. NPDC051102 TaxID=3155163 RepID=UPI0034444A17
MELRQLAVVVAVAEEGGFTAAAQRLRTVQSTVSTVVRALERDLGTPLFHRTTHRVVLTPAGEAFVPAARAALQAAERARAAVSPVGGEVRLGVCPGLLADLHRVLTALRQVHPGVGVAVRQLCAAKRWCASDVDVVLTVAPGHTAGGPVFRTPGNLARAGLASNGTHPASAPDHCAAEPVVTLLPPEDLVLATAPGGSRSAPGDLSSLSLVDFPPGWAIRNAVDQAFPDRRVTLEVDDLAVAAGLVRAGLAVCVLPASAAARFPELTVRRFDRPPPWQLAAVHRADVSPAVAALLAQLG